MVEKTEKTVNRPSKWSWVAQAMPGVQRLIAQARQELGEQWVNQCWAQGVVRGVAGHLWAAEGALAVGVPADVDVVSDWLQQRAADPGVAVLVVGDPAGQGRHVYCGCSGVAV